MKFGSELASSLYPSWRFYYLDYDETKRLLKSGTKDGQFTDKNEAVFVETLERELEKVATFVSTKGDELIRRVQQCEDSVDSILRNPMDLDPKRFHRVEQEISQITSDVAELSKFTRLNYSGFLKILKKHDKHTDYKLKPMFMVRLAARPFWKQSFDSLIIRLSKLYDVVRTGGRRPPTPPPSSGQSFIRRTTKYWVHPDNVTEVKIHILKHLPVLVFTDKGKENDPAISSVYFDNDSFELYLGRLEKSEGAQAVRLRWYGNMDQNEIFVERKTHKEDWTGETSIKARFPIKEKYVNAYLRGEYSMDRHIAKLRERKLKPEADLDDMQMLSNEIQETVKDKHLKPMVRTFYNRIAFQLPGDAVTFLTVGEDNFERDRSGPNWRRLDAGTIAPFTHLPEDDVNAFPYAVLEVKLQTAHGTESPQWVKDLVESHLVEEVPKFSKFIHGVATLLENRVTLLPFWLPQMDKDIRRSPSGLALSGLKASEDSLETPRPIDRSIDRSVDKKNKGKERAQPEIQVVINDGHDDHENEPDENEPLLGGPRMSDAQRRYDSILKTFKNLFGSTEFRPEVQAGGTPGAIPKSFQGKRIALPVRVEPKVFFANERTFLSWLHFCITLGALALGLLNFSEGVGQIAGVLFTLVSMMFMVYALFLYQWRAHKIRTRDPGPYDDRVGPTVLVVTLLCAIITNFVLKFSSHS